jgi:UvrD-like helicase C-terminal domain
MTSAVIRCAGCGTIIKPSERAYACHDPQDKTRIVAHCRSENTHCLMAWDGTKTTRKLASVPMTAISKRTPAFCRLGHEDDPLDLPPGGWMTAFAFGYAMTVHKAQGSEFDRVLLIDEWPGRDRTVGLYTAITRARTRIAIARNVDGVDGLL